MAVPDGWKQYGKCRDIPVDVADKLFFPEKQSNQAYRDAEAFCIDCPVRMTCLTYAIVFRIRWGAWGGLSPSRRTRFARGRRAKIIALWKTTYPITLERVS